MERASRSHGVDEHSGNVDFHGRSRIEGELAPPHRAVGVPVVGAGYFSKMEFELQYVYRGDSQPIVPTELAQLALAGSDSFLLTDTYFDGENLELRRAGCSLRVRVSNGDANARLTWKGKSKRRKRTKSRQEVEVPIAGVPADAESLAALLCRHGIDNVIRNTAGVRDPRRLRAIGQLRNDRSRHVYVNGLHRVDLTWDRLDYPLGPSEVRVEVEAKSKLASAYLGRADDELRALFGGDLAQPRRGKVHELCIRLYPELLPQN